MSWPSVDLFVLQSTIGWLPSISSQRKSMTVGWLSDGFAKMLRNTKWILIASELLDIRLVVIWFFVGDDRQTTEHRERKY